MAYFITNDNNKDVNSKIKLDANMFNCVCTTLGGTEKELKDAKDYLRFNIKENQLQTLLATLQSVSPNTNYEKNTHHYPGKPIGALFALLRFCVFCTL